MREHREEDEGSPSSHARETYHAECTESDGNDKHENFDPYDSVMNMR